MEKLKIFLFSNFQVHLDGTEITDSLRTRKERALLAYLAEEPSILQTREKIAEFFWPNRPENYARMNLRQALAGLRKSLGADDTASQFFEITDETIEFNHKHVWLDTRTFANLQQAIKQHPHHELHNCQSCMQKLEESITIYRGDFLSDLVLSELTSFQEWVILQRERHFRNYLEVLKALSKAYYYQLNWDKAYKYAYQYVEMAPMEEGAHRLLMRLLTLNGRRTAALQQYQMCKSIIKRELGIDPSLETQQLYQKIQNNLPVERFDTGYLSPKVAPYQTSRSADAATDLLYDPITNIPHRVIFMDRLRHAITRTRRNQNSLAVIILSLSFPKQSDLKPDQKRQIDTLLIRRLIGRVREDDTIARLQEDEYGLILEAIRDPSSVPLIIQKILLSVGTPLQIFEESIQTQVAIGWSISPQDGHDPDEILSKAEIAMRTDKLQKALHASKK